MRAWGPKPGAANKTHNHKDMAEANWPVSQVDRNRLAIPPGQKVEFSHSNNQATNLHQLRPLPFSFAKGHHAYHTSLLKCPYSLSPLFTLDSALLSTCFLHAPAPTLQVLPFRLLNLSEVSWLYSMLSQEASRKKPAVRNHHWKAH